jgi:hypothetical protein
MRPLLVDIVAEVDRSGRGTEVVIDAKNEEAAS